LLVNNPRDKDGRGLIVWIEGQRAFSVLLGFLEMSFAIGARRLVQLILGPDRSWTKRVSFY